MKKILHVIMSAVFIAAFLSGTAMADPDWYKGDTVIYTGAAMNLKPNVLFIIDNNSTMNDAAAGVSYDPNTTYPGTYSTWSAYKLTGQANYVTHISATSKANLQSNISCQAALDALIYNPGNPNNSGYGTYSGGTNAGLKSNGQCGNGGAGTVYLGNLLNFNQQGGSGSVTLAGTVSVMNNSFVVTGTGTSFLAKLVPGNNITINGVAYTVASVATDTSLTLASTYAGMGDTLSGTVAVANGSTAVTGTGTSFTTALTGTQIFIGNAWYTVAGVTSATSLTLTAAYAGTTSSGLSAYQATATGLEIKKVIDVTPQITLVRDAVIAVVGAAENAARFGLMTFNSNNKGGRIVYGVDDIDENKIIDFKSLLYGNTVGGTAGITLLGGETRPLAESLYDAGAYYKGNSSLPISGTSAPASPIQGDCQMNHVIIITNGDTIGDNAPTLGSMKILATDSNGDLDHDGLEGSGKSYGRGTHYLDDVAKYIYETRFSQSSPFPYQTKGWGWITTHAVLVFSPRKELLVATADGPDNTNASAADLLKKHGRGNYLLAANAAELADAIRTILTNIVQPKNSSFVAPVVPVSPENRTYSGSRVYMGFFKPESNRMWYGNLKKYALDSHNNIIDAQSPPQYANFVDLDGNGLDDRDNAILASFGAINGSFRPLAVSYWSKKADGTDMFDGGEVASGGAGQVLVDRTTARNIYTSTGSSDLTLIAFSTATNGTIGPLLGDLSVTPAPGGSATRIDALINFVNGFDAYSTTNPTLKRQWIMGDVLHSKPYVVNYAAYTMSSSNESDCDKNKTIIYVGSNDGMLHAFRDCDGSEAWAFIPPDLLSNLRFMTAPNHTYFADSSVAAYIYDKNHNGTIDSDDKVFLIFGVRRGGGVMDTSPTTGSYYALDVSAWDNASKMPTPTFKWKISNSGTIPPLTLGDFSELGETFSEPKIVKMKIGTSDTIVAFIGGGYDNCNEDARYGATQGFTGNCVASVITGDDGLNADNSPKTSSPSTSPKDPKGRAIYAVEVATLGSTGAPQFGNSGHQIWFYKNTSLLTFSVPNEMAAVDVNYDGYIDTLYGGDTGGNIWAFDVGDPNKNWGARKIFSSNPAGTDIGRKIFYKPAVTIEPDSVMVFFGTGDREHPLNRAVTDRMYGLIDRGQTTTTNESNLVDVTLDKLQAGNDTDISQTLSDLADTTKYGWFIKLDGGDRSVTNPGEKVLSSPVVFNKVAYFTTYSPNTVVSSDPCADPPIGTGRIYAVNYKTGEAVINYDPTNDTTVTSNARATATPGQVLLRSDRVKTLGEGIPSGVVLVVSASGELTALIGTGGNITSEMTKKGGTIIPVYWRQK